MFKVQRTQETVNKTLRFPKDLIEKISKIAQNENVSINSFIIQCCEYAIDNMQQSKDQ